MHKDCFPKPNSCKCSEEFPCGGCLFQCKFRDIMLSAEKTANLLMTDNK